MFTVVQTPLIKYYTYLRYHLTLCADYSDTCIEEGNVTTVDRIVIVTFLSLLKQLEFLTLHLKRLVVP